MRLYKTNEEVKANEIYIEGQRLQNSDMLVYCLSQ